MSADAEVKAGSEEDAESDAVDDEGGSDKEDADGRLAGVDAEEGNDVDAEREIDDDVEEERGIESDDIDEVVEEVDNGSCPFSSLSLIVAPGAGVLARVEVGVCVLDPM